MIFQAAAIVTWGEGPDEWKHPLCRGRRPCRPANNMMLHSSWPALQVKIASAKQSFYNPYQQSKPALPVRVHYFPWFEATGFEPPVF